MTRPTSVVLGLSAAATALSLTFVNSTGVASAATTISRTALPASVAPAHPTTGDLTSILNPLSPGARRRALARRAAAGSGHHAARRGAADRTRHRTARRTYTVKPGDSFWSIAKAEGIDWYNLAADNGLHMYSVLDAGQVLELPARGEKAHAAMPLQPTATTRAAAPASDGEASGDPTTATVQPADSSGSSSFEQCVISRESGGDADVTNGGGYWGLFQFSPSTWSSYGGEPADFGRASAGEQEQVFQNAVAAGGASNWAPYDGC